MLTSMTLVIVPLELVFHAPLQSQGLLQDAGSALQPYPQPTEAPSFVSQPVISQQPPFAEAIFTFVRCESPGVTHLVHFFVDEVCVACGGCPTRKSHCPCPAEKCSRARRTFSFFARSAHDYTYV